jgi:eukaryotic-like serine/threonine-protein kinase
MRRTAAPWWVYLCAASFLAYFVLLLTCDIVRPIPEGFEPKAVPGAPGLVVEDVASGSPAARAGIRPGDIVLRADGHRISSRTDWEGIQVTVRLGRPVSLDLLRDGRPVRAEWVVTRAPASYWTRREGLQLLVTRVVQLVSLLLGLVVVFRRPFDGGARLGGWLLATIGVLCITLPYRLADAWGSLHWLLGGALWLPFCCSFALPALLLSFFLSFPRLSLRSPVAWVATWLPAVIVVSGHLSYFARTVYAPTEPRQAAPWFEWWRWVVWIGYLVATATAALLAYRRADLTERRRLGVMLLGGGAGAVAGGPIALAYWRGSETGLFESPAVALATLLLLAVPLSFAYAILRHRLFDVRVIIRQGVRYALARKLLISIVPIVILSLAADVYHNRDRAVAELFGVRAPAYLAVAAIALLAQWRRSAWLEALDRRFFRERYDAQRLLRGIVDELHREDRFDAAAGRVVAQIEVALHPTFVALLARRSARDAYVRLAGVPAGRGPVEMPADGRLAALARALGKPLDLSAAGARWLAERLPATEAEVVKAVGMELVVPIESADGQSDALLVLGERRSEEPYAPEDQDLLWTIARSVAVLVHGERRSGEPYAPEDQNLRWTIARSGAAQDRRDRASSGAAVFQECPRCGTCYDSGTPACNEDAGPLSVVSLPRVLASRYRLEKRLGRGGMGIVYGATDLSLGRGVAVKVLREELVGDPDSAERFELEARTSALFTHPHVVTIHDFGIVHGTRAFLVMERLEGTTLRDELSRAGRIDASRVLSIMRGVCSAVEAAHRRSLVHRDLKPENVFLADNDGIETPKVLDFGIAKVMSPGAPGDGRETRAGVMLGTPQYMAPEQLRGEAPAPSWDVWALAVMTCEMLTGTHPFATPAFGLSSAGAPAAQPVIASDSPIEPAWPPYLARWLSIDQARRPTGAGEFVRELEQMLASR